MALHIAFFSYTAQTWDRLTSEPADRSVAVRAAVEELGGHLVGMYYMMGPFDGLVIMDVPDTTTAAAVALLATRTGAYRHMETHPLIEPSAMPDLLTKVHTASARFVPPGQQTGPS